MTQILKLLAVGYAVLAVAIGVNILADIVGLTTWYEFIGDPSVQVVDVGFLFVLYPLTLGLAATGSLHLWDRLPNQ